MDTRLATNDVMESVRLLMSGAIDYAGLFPPSAVSMPEAVLNYATYRNSNYSWMLGRFVVSVARLEEFYEAARDFVSRDAAHSWRVAVVAGEDLHATIRQVEDFNATNGPGIVCDVIEMKADTVYQIESISKSLPRAVTVYFEIDPKVELVEKLMAIAAGGQRAKLRTGGITPEAFPKSVDIVRFVTACVAANVPFKATAGLHHPIRCFRPLTYEANSAKGTMHGFLNLFLMTGFAIESYRRSFLEDVMEEEFEEVFAVEPQSISWRGEYALNVHQIERLRTIGIQSFGSCSFDEPVADLQTLGML
ncbi:MAG TPA: hypothetical protein PKA82_05845 [Pyrinomonadaceae bacterium]|nr:hypothetical protein [Pyrinomonadaceae bacterium]